MIDFLLIVTLPVILEQAMRNLIKPNANAGADDESFLEQVVKGHVTFMMSQFVLVREFSGVVDGFSQYSGPAGIKFFQEMTKLAVQAKQGEVDSALLRSVNKAAGILFHLPALQADRTVRGMISLLNGEVSDPRALLVGPPRRQ